MHGQIITIGNELVSGRTLDLNSWYAAGRLTAAGFHVTRVTSVGDDQVAITDILRETVQSSRFVIVTGGLGSTDDDITSEAAACALNRPLSLDQQMYAMIKGFAGERGIEMTPALEKMAWMPEGSRMMNPRGRACGYCLTQDGVHLYFLPGVPDQMRYLMDKFVLPELLSFYKTLPVMRQRIIKLYGISEPGIAEIFQELRGEMEGVVFGFYPHFPENHITVSLRGENEGEVAKELDRAEREIKRLAGTYIFATGHESMEKKVGQMLLDNKATLSVAESCTGGLIGHRLTNVAGSSGYFLGSLVVYSNEAKKDLLHVSPETLEKYGAVSDQTAREMAQGVRERLKTDLGLAVTGIAGPDGGSREKPVGTVYIAMAHGDEILSGKYRFWGNREQVKLNTSMMALDWVRRRLHGDPFLPGI
ncbi:MAG: CinA family nicotinamide mononucleotide deamidase-related protein [Deltaproteobacteria bacterium]|nr:CinA family nicotinamide mononucleotide deamidase-related protein [Deltaproteobacteria bacterium]